MDITSIKEKYLVDINKNYVPKTAVEARLGTIEKGRNNKAFFTNRNAQQEYRVEIQNAKKEYESALKTAKEQYEKQSKKAKEQYQVRLREAKRGLKESLASERSGKHKMYSTTREYYKLAMNRQ